MLDPIVHEGRVLFSFSELACPHCRKGKLAPHFGVHLKELRVAVNQPMLLNSACRCADYNKSEDIGGHPRSLHVFDFPHHPTEGTCAIDVSMIGRSAEYRNNLIFHARRLGWSIGHANSFLHLDRRGDYTNLPRAEYNY